MEIKFDCDNVLTWYDYVNSPWGENRESGYNLVKDLKPKRIVELGSYLGCSTFAFAQACKDNHIPCEINAIDSWAGDEHSGFYDNQIYFHFLDVKNTAYKFENIKVHRLMFDQALELFKDKSIDLLHIDGLHTYEAVKADFEKWLPKVKKGGVILFHDVNVHKDDFGVWKFWEEIEGLADIQDDYGLPGFDVKKIDNVNGLGVLYV